jgi:hypothetical protein
MQDPAIYNNLLQILIQKYITKVALINTPKQAVTGGGLLPNKE